MGKSLKNYVNYFQIQMSLMHNCNEDIAATPSSVGYKPPMLSINIW